MTLIRHNIVDLYWTTRCRGDYDTPAKHAECFGLVEQPPEDETISQSFDFTRCVCPCHDGFDPETGERRT